MRQLTLVCGNFKEHGYMLRPRYRPGWKPAYNPKKVLEAMPFEDGQPMIHSDVMDALRMSDSLVVAFKRVKLSEARIATLFSNDINNLHPRNHCVRLLEVLPVPNEDDKKILVMVWMRPVMNPRFRTVGEAIQFFTEMIEGLQYMHENNVAHRDCSINNMAMDANSMYPRPFHPMKPKKRYDWSH
ncbi:hypothetical protein EV361DRAFT_812323 [Lentinula raphanica]|nr:hypothetical protein EV361DRAFT_812323 [Lentinula raphanica]